MGAKSPGPSLEVHKAVMAEVVKGVSGAGRKSWDAVAWGLERLGKEEVWLGVLSVGKGRG